MKIKTILKRTGFVIIALLLSLFCFFESALSIKANAETTTEYSDVLTDLQKDEAFDISKYKEDIGDYGLTVIQIAESSDGELFIYVHRPSAIAGDELIATKISLSTAWGGCEDFRVYRLELLSTSGVFDKYRVIDLKVENIVMRYYHINSIYRAFFEEVDMGTTDDNTISDVAYGVGQLWTATTVNGTVSYLVDYLELITVTSKHVGFIRYLDNKVLLYAKEMTDSHYVAFSTDHPIDDLLEAELTYSYESYYEYDRMPDSDLSTLFQNQDYKNVTTYGNNITRTLKKEEVFETNNWFFFDDYKYNRIQEIDTFIKNESEELLDETEEALKDKQWVLRFLETEYDYFNQYVSDTYFPYSYTIKQWTNVTNVGILRLKFLYDGDIYDMGVIDNLSQGDEVPDNKNPYDIEYPDWLSALTEFLVVLIILGGAGVLLSFIPGLGAIFGLVFNAILTVIGWLLKGVVFVIKWIFKIVFWVIAFPFNLIGKLFKRNKKNE